METLVSLDVEYYLLMHIYRTYMSILSSKFQPETDSRVDISKKKPRMNFVRILYSGWKTYIQQVHWYFSCIDHQGYSIDQFSICVSIHDPYCTWINIEFLSEVKSNDILTAILINNI